MFVEEARIFYFFSGAFNKVYRNKEQCKNLVMFQEVFRLERGLIKFNNYITLERGLIKCNNYIREVIKIKEIQSQSNLSFEDQKILKLELLELEYDKKILEYELEYDKHLIEERIKILQTEPNIIPSLIKGTIIEIRRIEQTKVSFKDKKRLKRFKYFIGETEKIEQTGPSDRLRDEKMASFFKNLRKETQ